MKKSQKSIAKCDVVAVCTAEWSFRGQWIFCQCCMYAFMQMRTCTCVCWNSSSFRFYSNFLCLPVCLSVCSSCCCCCCFFFICLSYRLPSRAMHWNEMKSSLIYLSFEYFVHCVLCVLICLHNATFYCCTIYIYICIIRCSALFVSQYRV